MNKFIIIVLLAVLQLALACHPSCNCAANSNVCISCKQEGIGAVIDDNQRSCPCPPGYYTKSLYPDFSCVKLISTDAGAELMDACQLEIGQKTKDIKVDTNCHFQTFLSMSLVVSSVSLNFNKISISNECKEQYQTRVQFKNISDGEWYDIGADYITEGPYGSQTLTWPLIEVSNFSTKATVGDSQIVQIIHLRIKIGHSVKYVRYHSWDLTVYTNRNEVQVFNIDVSAQQTNGCQDGQECIIVADLDTIGSIKEDNKFITDKAKPYLYHVGDIFYAKIVFADPTYTKRLIFDGLFFKSDQGKIFNFSSITTAYWDGTGLTIALQLVEPTMSADIQINMKISTENKLRFLQQNTDNQISVERKFSATILPDNSSQNISNSNQNTPTTSHSNIILLFTIYLISFFLI